MGCTGQQERRIVYVHDANIYGAEKTFGRHKNRERQGVVVHAKEGSVATFIDAVVRRTKHKVLKLLNFNKYSNQIRVGLWHDPRGVDQRMGPARIHRRDPYLNWRQQALVR